MLRKQGVFAPFFSLFSLRIPYFFIFITERGFLFLSYALSLRGWLIL